MFIYEYRSKLNKPFCHGFLHIGLQWRDRNLSSFIKNICVLKMKDMRVSESEQIITESSFMGEGEK